MLLAIDTATRNASIALYNGDGVQAEVTWHTRENHTVELMSQIVQMLNLARVEKKDLQAIGVALGPGSFTGLRVGMSTAKGLSFARQVPILGISTLDSIAHAHSLQPLPLYAMVGAGRRRLSVARYVVRDGAAVRGGDHALVDADGLLEFANRDGASRILFCGEVEAAIVEKIKECFGERARVAAPAFNARRAAFLAELAWARFTRGESDDTASLAPIYATINPP